MEENCGGGGGSTRGKGVGVLLLAAVPRAVRLLPTALSPLPTSAGFDLSPLCLRCLPGRFGSVGGLHAVLCCAVVVVQQALSGVAASAGTVAEFAMATVCTSYCQPSGEKPRRHADRLHDGNHHRCNCSVSVIIMMMMMTMMMIPSQI